MRCCRTAKRAISLRSKRTSRCSLRPDPLYLKVEYHAGCGRSTTKQCSTNQLAAAARWPPMEELPLDDAARGVFMTRPCHTSSRETDVQAVV